MTSDIVDRFSENETLAAIGFSFAEGMILGGIARGVGSPAVIGIPVAMDVMHNMRVDRQMLLSYIAYGAGASVAYADKFYGMVAPLLDR